VLIEDVTVIAVREARALPHRIVAISGTRITAVAPAGELRAGDHPGAALAVATFLPAYVANGVTGIRDMGGDLRILTAVRDSIRSGSPRFPRICAAGAVLDGPEPVDPSISIAVADSKGARPAVDSLRNAGADFLKVYTLLTRAGYFAIVTDAHRTGMPVAGHVPAEVTPAEAAAAGQRSVEHLNDELEPLCTRATAEACASRLAQFRRHGTWQVPTLVVLRMKAYADEALYTVDPR